MYKVMKNIHISDHFTIAEFTCNDGSGEVIYSRHLIELLEKIRVKVGKPIIINSGYRNPGYNRKVGGSPKSQHMLGTAADIRIKGLSSKAVADIAIECGARGVGVYDTFTHVDVRYEPKNVNKGYDFWDMRTK
ncbi:Peptidase M15 [Peptoclostridium litorale DSM 5388]|uniref:Murein endopeptidase K n=1 Tax=Peptoclostridium litorale DSM 5388 TaxID=1121324 RepID=A0A069RFU2_PEPLI|nr:D-Ala-D-Ala carboxypeptidase family metallohydrolase [Peptoclostridium litorale]KDR95891.1 peptidase M15A [Peptoclostridium litorale DSM 5388]SIO10568.1 Peptidase M15 [Peptoclostridium litorale DSM 5388]